MVYYSCLENFTNRHFFILTPTYKKVILKTFYLTRENILPIHCFTHTRTYSGILCMCDTRTNVYEEKMGVEEGVGVPNYLSH